MPTRSLDVFRTFRREIRTTSPMVPPFSFTPAAVFRLRQQRLIITSAKLTTYYKDMHATAEAAKDEPQRIASSPRPSPGHWHSHAQHFYTFRCSTLNIIPLLVVVRFSIDSLSSLYFPKQTWIYCADVNHFRPPLSFSDPNYNLGNRQ